MRSCHAGGTQQLVSCQCPDLEQGAGNSHVIMYVHSQVEQSSDEQLLQGNGRPMMA